MIGANSLYPEDWKEKARKDWRRITVLLMDNDVEGAAFFLQQIDRKNYNIRMRQSQGLSFSGHNGVYRLDFFWG
ncbi:MAG TPA: hypothetical protein ENI73_06635, partial [Spirochaetes bacterium]|nr:hypothetical protein [Spirochaetota bacterium]